jgi:phenylpropionate dioxygenase-like ring-hydroxylating dioxygenase large terminal subunit
MALRRPATTSFAPDEWDLLARYWHPVATTAEIDAGSHRSLLLDVPLVVWRGPDGVAVVAPDSCPHRRARLSAGCVDGGVLQCPYHGVEFGAAGRAVHVPSAPEAPVPPALHLAVLPSVERHGLVWTCFSDDPAGELPDWSDLDVPGRQRGSCTPGVWPTSALRHAENFNDLAHFAFVHRATFGVGAETDVAPLDLVVDGDTLVVALSTVQLDREVLDEDAEAVEVRYVYRWMLPFSSLLVIEYPGGRTEWICDAAAPVTSSSCRVYVEKSRDHDQDQPVERWIAFQEAVNDEDRRILALVDPPDPGLVITGEVHLRADTVSVAARRWFRSRLTATRSDP